MAAAATLSTVRSRPALAAVACSLQLLVTVPLAAVLNVWRDDAYTLHSTSSTLGYAFHEAIGFEQNAPLYFVVMNLWRHIDGSAFFARLFSVICAAIVVALTPKLARRYLPSIDARLVTFTVALNPFLIWTALEIRVYALIVLVSALLLLNAYDAFMRDDVRPAAAWWYALCVAVGVYTQYYIAFLVVAIGAYVLLAHRRSFRRCVAASAAGALTLVPMLLIVLGQVSNFRGEFAVPTIPQSLRWLTGILFARYVLPLQFIGHRKILYGALLAVALVFAFAARKRISRSGDAAAIVILAAGFAAFIIGTHAAGVRILTRHPVSLLLPAIFVPFAVISFVRVPQRARAAAVWSAIALLVAVCSLVATYRFGAKDGDWRRVTAYVEQHEVPGEPIAVFEAENALPFGYYYRGVNRVIALPRGVNFSDYDVEQFVVRDAGQIAARIPKGAREVWLIRAGDCASANIAFGCDVVERYFKSHYRVLLSRRFYKSSVQLLEAARRSAS